jgi:hypothetical protein
MRNTWNLYVLVIGIVVLAFIYAMLGTPVMIINGETENSGQIVYPSLDAYKGEGKAGMINYELYRN